MFKLLVILFIIELYARVKKFRHFTTCSSVSIVKFEQGNADWVCLSLCLTLINL